MQPSVKAQSTLGRVAYHIRWQLSFDLVRMRAVIGDESLTLLTSSGLLSELCSSVSSPQRHPASARAPVLTAAEKL